MAKKDKKIQEDLVNEMMKVSKTNPDVMIYMQSLMKCYEDLEEENKKLQEEKDHYKHLYSLVKKQKDDVIEYIKYQLSNLDLEKDEDVKAKMLGSMILVMLEDNRMLGEVDE